MKNEHTMRGTLQVIERMNNSTSGNPRYRVAIVSALGDASVFVTRPDDAFNYEVTNFEGHTVDATVGTFRNKDTITDVTHDFGVEL